jgi:hypothetical protein
LWWKSACECDIWSRLLFNLNNKSISVQLRFFIFLKFEIEIILWYSIKFFTPYKKLCGIQKILNFDGLFKKKKRF